MGKTKRKDDSLLINLINFYRDKRDCTIYEWFCFCNNDFLYEKMSETKYFLTVNKWLHWNDIYDDRTLNCYFAPFHCLTRKLEQKDYHFSLGEIWRNKTSKIIIYRRMN